MPVFEYKAIQANGAAAQGRIDAGGRQDAARMLEDRGLTPIRLAEADAASAKNGSRPSAPAAAGASWSFKSHKVTFAALEDFTRSVSSLLAGNVPLSRALTIL